MANQAKPMLPPPTPRALDDYFLMSVAVEVARARSLHAPINSSHEGYAVILEELDEFWVEVKKKRRERDPAAMFAELVQIAAMACRTSTDCRLDPHD